jgi:hypothetical protein
MWGALSDGRTGLSFTIAAGPCQRSHSLVQAPLDSRPYFTVSDLIFPISSPPTTRSVTVEVFDPASTQVTELTQPGVITIWSQGRLNKKQCLQQFFYCYGQLPSNRPDIVSIGTHLPSHCSEMAICLFMYCLEMAVLIVCFEVFA